MDANLMEVNEFKHFLLLLQHWFELVAVEFPIPRCIRSHVVAVFGTTSFYLVTLLEGEKLFFLELNEEMA
jgi:hypothetical protein